MAVTAFRFDSVPALVAGSGCAAQLGEHLAGLGVARVLLVTDPGLLRLGLIAPIAAALAASGVRVQVYGGVREDPPESVVTEAASLGRKNGVDGVLGVGGGSSLDVAKVVAVLLASSQALGDMYGVDRITGGRLPLVLVPTTAGTGSEATPVAVLTTGETTKAGISSRALLPDLALLDPDLTLGLPPRVTAMTGIDAMVHAIEAYTSRLRRNPVSDMLARQALGLLTANLRRVVADGGDRQARAAMLLGAFHAGQAFANAPVAAVHALAYPLGGRYHIPHGLSNSLVLPSVLRFNMPAAAERYAELAALVDPALTGSSEARADALVASLESLIADAGLPATLREAGVEESSLEILAADAMEQQRLLVNNPREVSAVDALSIYRRAWG